ncbi:MAG: hypothetical protein M3389_02910 [Actinomycetota bacterium]|nr:hypothetical protein [Actinomycetota bacterium]
MASADRNSVPGPTFPTALVAGLLAFVVVAIVAWVAVGAELGIPVLVLGAICAAAAIAYRTIGTSRSAPTDNRDSVPRLSAEGDRPLGDTPEAHDEINPHDLPPDHPGRHAAEEMAQGDEGETAGMESGGAAGEGGSEEDDGRSEPQGEAKQGATTTD